MPNPQGVLLALDYRLLYGLLLSRDLLLATAIISEATPQQGGMMGVVVGEVHVVPGLKVLKRHECQARVEAHEARGRIQGRAYVVALLIARASGRSGAV